MSSDPIAFYLSSRDIHVCVTLWIKWLLIYNFYCVLKQAN